MDDHTTNEIIQEVEDLCKVDMYWNMSHPGMGVSADSADTASGEGLEGWEVMYVRLRGKAVWEGE